MQKPLMSKTQNICLIILCILFILLGYIVITNMLDKKRNQETEYNVVDVSPKKLLSLEKFNYCHNLDSIINKLYENKIDELEKKEKLLLILNGIEANTNLKDINELASIFGENFTFDDLKIVEDYFKIKVNGEELTISKIDEVCDSNNNLVIKFIEAKENNKYLNVYYHVAFGSILINDEGNKVINYYEDYNKKRFVEQVSFIDKEKIDLDKYATIKIVYSIDNDKYLLENIENV